MKNREDYRAERVAAGLEPHLPADTTEEPPSEPSAYDVIVEWEGITAHRKEIHGPFATEDEAWDWWRAQIGYPRGTQVRLCPRD
jgi:hypothetical protein